MMAVLAGTFATSVAVATFVAFVVGNPPARSGGLATVPTGTVHDAIVNPQRPVPGGGALLTVPPFGFVSVIVSTETPFSDVGLGLKLLLIAALVGSMTLAMRAPVLKSPL